MPESMSDPQNTALGGFLSIGYSHVTQPTKPNRHSQPLHAMLTLTLLLAALVLLTSWDASAAEAGRQAIPVESDEPAPSSRR